MLELPPPPEPPHKSQETLEQLSAYYQETIEYYSLAIAIAKKKLAALEILLDRNNQPVSPSCAQLSPKPTSGGNSETNNSSTSLNGTANGTAPNGLEDCLEGQLSLLDSIGTSVVPASTPNINGHGEGADSQRFESTSAQVGSPQVTLSAPDETRPLARPLLEEAESGNSQEIIQPTVPLKSLTTIPIESSVNQATTSTTPPQISEYPFEQIAPKIKGLLESNPGKILPGVNFSLMRSGFRQRYASAGGAAKAARGRGRSSLPPNSKLNGLVCC